MQLSRRQRLSSSGKITPKASLEGMITVSNLDILQDRTNVSLNTTSESETSPSATNKLYEGPRRPTGPGTPSLYPSKDARRLARYSNAERSLATEFQKCAAMEEVSPQELQIRALKQAAEILKHHANDARENLQKLRSQLLAYPGADTTMYESAKRERWMEEKRSLAFSEEAELVERMLKSLQQSEPTNDASDQQESVQESRRQVNLARFLSSSHTKRRISIGDASSTAAIARRSLDLYSRRRTMHDVSPLRLSASASQLNHSSHAAYPFTHIHTRSSSLDGQHRRALASHLHHLYHRGITPTTPAAARHHRPLHSLLSVVTEDDSGLISSPSTPIPIPISSAHTMSSSSSETSSHSAPSTPPPPPDSSSPSHFLTVRGDGSSPITRGSGGDNGGTALIYSDPGSERSRADILSVLEDVDYGKEFEATISDSFISTPDLSLWKYAQPNTPSRSGRGKKGAFASSPTRSLTHRVSQKILRKKPSITGDHMEGQNNVKNSPFTTPPPRLPPLPDFNADDSDALPSPIPTPSVSSSPSKKNFVGRIRSRFSLMSGSPRK